MKRVSKLELLVKLARHEESRALTQLGEARAVVDACDRRLAEIHASVDSSLRESSASRMLRFASDLAANERHRGALRHQATTAVQEREAGLLAVEEARQEVARARLRVRAIENAMERRAARERLERDRMQTRRLDESVRQIRERANAEREADSDALA